MENNQLAPRATGQLAAPRNIDEAPEFQPAEMAEQLRIPRLVLIQEKHKGIKEGWAKVGDLANSLTKESYGRSVQVVGVCQRPVTRIRWGQRSAGGGQLCISRNKQKPQGDPGNDYADCTQCQFYADKDPKTGCSMNYEIVALVVTGNDPHFWEPILLTAEFTRPSDAGIRNMLEMARHHFNRTSGQIRMFHKSYQLSVVDAQNKFGEFFKTTCSPGSFGSKENNGLLPLDVIDYLEGQMKFFKGATLDEGHPAEVAGEEVPY